MHVLTNTAVLAGLLLKAGGEGAQLSCELLSACLTECSNKKIAFAQSKFNP